MCLVVVTQPNRMPLKDKHRFFRSAPEPVPSSAKGLLQTVNMLLEDVFLHAFKNLITVIQFKLQRKGKQLCPIYTFSVFHSLMPVFHSLFFRPPGKTPSEFSNPNELVADSNDYCSLCRSPYSSFRKMVYNTKGSGATTPETGYFRFVALCERLLKSPGMSII